MELSKLGLPILEMALQFGEEEVKDLVEELDELLPESKRSNYWTAQ